MSDMTGSTPGSGPGFPVYGADAGPPPGAAQPASPAPLPPTPELRREAAQRIMTSKDYLNENAAIRAPLVREVQRLLAADNPTDTRPRNEITNMIEADPPPAPPVPPVELERKLHDHLKFAPETPWAERTDFIEAARDGLAALQATHAEAGHFINAMSDAFKQPALDSEQAAAVMQREWGADYAQNLAFAKAAAQRLPPHVRAQLTEIEAIGNAPAVLKLLAAAGRRMSRR